MQTPADQPAPSAPGLHSRRAALLGLTGLGVVSTLGLAGCGDLVTTAPALAPSQGRRAVSDQVLLTEALAAEQTALAMVEALRKKHRSLRAATARARRTHTGHAALLEKATEGADGAEVDRPSGADLRVPGQPKRALAALARLEADTAAQHVETAMAAESGSFARVLASMAAASSQLEVSLRAAAGAGGSS